MTIDDYNFYKRSGKCRNTLYKTKSYLVVKIHVNHVDVCTLLHFWSTLHSETDMADTFDRVRFSKLFLHHCNEVKSSIIFFNDVPFSSKLYQKWWNLWMWKFTTAAPGRRPLKLRLFLCADFKLLTRYELIDLLWFYEIF